MTPSSTDPTSSADVNDDAADSHRLSREHSSDLAIASARTKPKTPQGRIDRWHRKLLDLTLRNRLLNFKATKKTIPFLCPEASGIENRLADGKSLKILAQPDRRLREDQDAPDDEGDFELHVARKALERGEIHSKLPQDELVKRLTTLYRSSRNDISEGGSNTLYLAVGFLKWKEKAGDSRSYQAPLLLIPTKLLRRNARSTYRLAHHEDDVRFNATLIQFLKRDFDCDLSQFENDLPKDDSGVDVPQVLKNVREAVAALPGFEVIEASSLASFSFAKYLMWKDLVDRSDHLEQNRVVRHLVRNPELAFQPAVEHTIPRAEEMDERFAPKDLIHPLDADSTQLAAVMAAAEGHDFVLVGPPGTGKSQTIANMIAQCLANGKTVLFVAEKTAALDVVQRRLHQHGLGDFCVELHSNKAERKRFLRQLDRAWNHGRPNGSQTWEKVNDELELTRDQLNDYVAALHHQSPNGWTPYRAMGIVVSGEDTQAPELHWAKLDGHSENDYEELEKAAKQIGLSFDAVKSLKPLSPITRSNWSMQWERKLLEQCGKIASAVDDFRPILADFASALRTDPRDGSGVYFRCLYKLAVELTATANENFETALDAQLDQLPAHLNELDEAIRLFDQASASCSVTFEDDALRTLNIDQLEHDWTLASESYWPLSTLRKRSVKKRIQAESKLGATDPGKDLPFIRIMQTQLKIIESNPLADRKHLWQHRRTAIASVEEYLRRCRTLRDHIRALSDAATLNGEGSDALRQSLAPVLAGASSELPLVKAALSYRDGFESFDATLGGFQHLAGSRICPAEAAHSLDAAIEMSDRIQKSRTSLQRWTIWQGVKQRAIELGLAPMVNACEEGEIPIDEIEERFELSYVRWWLSGTIDSNDVLRQFQRIEHEDLIRRFVQTDEQARQSASDRVRGSIAHRLPEQSEVPRKSELGMLRHQIGLKRPSKSIRELVSMMPEHFSALAPCLLMSPLSIAQYLPAEQPPFDVVIFDEASQITTWDAIGAIARGKQTIIVGDPRQLPPTNFFGAANEDDDDEELEDYERDMESILDEAKASGLPTLQLNWHYRSRHESLIAFSNRNYYDDQLVTFPSPETHDSAVSFRHLPDTKYDRGKTRTNVAEAEAIVTESVARMKDWLSLPEDDRKTIGVVTFNSQQQTLIQDLFDEAQRQAPELEWYFSDERVEPTVVKNLENVQGDERDVMLFSITFGPDESGNVPLTFGALNRDGGERRLNVAVTRAREELVVFASFRPDQLNVERTQSRGVADLKQFLAFAQQSEYESAVDSLEGDVRSRRTLESAIAIRLRSRGWDVVQQVGVSGFRVPLAVRHPHDKTVYLAGIECDGATYRNSATARDRDLTRQLVLENLGWKILRVWSRDWWYDPEGASRQLDEALRSIM